MRSESTRARKLPGSYQVALIAVLALTGAGFGLGAAGYRINATNSLPPGIWKVVALDSPPAHGDIVSVCPPAVKALEDAKSRGYLHTGTCSGWFEPLFKPVAAVPGDTVTVTPEGLRVNGAPIANSIALAVDGNGAELPHLAAGKYVVGAGEIWVVSAYNRWSFDSRYFGPVSLASVQGRAIPVLVQVVPPEWR